MSELAKFIAERPGRTQQEWAEMFDISRSFLSEILSGAKMPGRKTMQRIAEATEDGVPVTAWFQSGAGG